MITFSSVDPGDALPSAPVPPVRAWSSAARRSPGAGVGDLGPDPEDEAREWRIADRVAKSKGAEHLFW